MADDEQTVWALVTVYFEEMGSTNGSGHNDNNGISDSDLMDLGQVDGKPLLPVIGAVKAQLTQYRQAAVPVAP